MPELVYLNGSLVAKEDAKVHVLDRGFLFGDGLYEVTPFYDGKLYRLPEHMERFYFGIEGLEMPIGKTSQEFAKLVTQLVKDSGLANGTVYWEHSRGSYDPRTHYYTDEMTEPTTLIHVKPAKEKESLRQTQGTKVSLQPDHRWMKCCYKTVNLVANCLAATKARKAGGVEALLYRSDEHVTEGASSTFFIVKDGEVITHPANDLILAGVTRAVVLELCQKHGIPCREKVFGLKDLEAADEVFRTGTTTEVEPVVQIDGMVVGNGRPGPISRKLCKLYTEDTGQK